MKRNKPVSYNVPVEDYGMVTVKLNVNNPVSICEIYSPDGSLLSWGMSRRKGCDAFCEKTAKKMALKSALGYHTPEGYRIFPQTERRQIWSFFLEKF